MTGPAKREFIASVMMVEDDLGRLRNFCHYAKARGDMHPWGADSANRFREVIKEAEGEARSCDVFLLDVRLPEHPAETCELHPEEFPPHGVALARRLAEGPRTSTTPVMIYTQYAYHPLIGKELDQLEADYMERNVVAVRRTRPSIMETIYLGLRHVYHFDVAVRYGSSDPPTFFVSSGDETGPEDLTNARFLLNGCQPRATTHSPQQDGLDLVVRFEEAALFERDHNYLMIESENGKKSILPVNDLPRRNRR